MKAGESLQKLVKMWAAVPVLLLYLSGLKLSQSFLRKLRKQIPISLSKRRDVYEIASLSSSLACSVGAVV